MDRGALRCWEACARAVCKRHVATSTLPQGSPKHTQMLEEFKYLAECSVSVRCWIDMEDKYLNRDVRPGDEYAAGALANRAGHRYEMVTFAQAASADFHAKLGLPAMSSTGATAEAMRTNQLWKAWQEGLTGFVRCDSLTLVDAVVLLPYVPPPRGALKQKAGRTAPSAASVPGPDAAAPRGRAKVKSESPEPRSGAKAAGMVKDRSGAVMDPEAVRVDIDVAAAVDAESARHRGFNPWPLVLPREGTARGSADRDGAALRRRERQRLGPAQLEADGDQPEPRGSEDDHGHGPTGARLGPAAAHPG